MRTVASVMPTSRVMAPPLWRAIADDIVQRIDAGLLKPGDALPSQAEIAAQWECSLAPVKRAIAYLDATGVIVARPGMRARVALPERPCDDTQPHEPHTWRPDMQRDVRCPGVQRPKGR